MALKAGKAKRREATALRHFVGDHHPVFRKTQNVKGKFYTESIYYWWFVTLRRSKRYEMACQRNGYGMTELYNDFGDVFAYDETKDGFQQWWREPVFSETEDGSQQHDNNRGAYLFAEPLFNFDVERIQQDDLAWVHEHWNAREFHVFTIPNNLQKREVLKRVAKALDDAPHRTETEGKRFKKVSKARYPVESTYRFELEFTSDDGQPKLKKGGHLDNIRNSLYVYDDWQTIQKEGIKEPKWAVMWEAEGEEPENWDEQTRGKFDIYGDSGKGYRNYYNVRFDRRMKTVESLIAGVEEGRFPVTQWKGYNKQLAERAKTDKKERKPIERSHRRGPYKR